MSSRELECLADCGTTHTILRHRQLFSNLTPTYSSVTTMAGPSNLVQGRGPAQFLLPNGTIIDVTHALYAPRGNRTLLSFKDIRANGYHAETHDENGKEFICITSNDCGRKRILEKFMCISSGSYSTTIRAIESNNVIRDDLFDSDTYWLWHDRLGHPGREMMIRILKTSHGHPFFRANQSMNRKTFREDKTAMKRGKFAAVRRLSTGRGQNADRSTNVLYRRRPVDDNADQSRKLPTGRHQTERIIDRSIPSSTGRTPMTFGPSLQC
ncbi:hypothetical protein M0R45_008564 [Rubus argutus]|uniref:Retrovirus-related Pol polyprotein from transposon TNT 1-94-like beta-barrel domain-containing protein n=1 Tax=Rubus argutus TaxID=59490 RepID=A0AAW1Y2I2_RUBAR